MAVFIHTKQSLELYPISIDFTDRLPDGITLTAATVIATDPAGVDVTADTLGTPVVSSPVVTIPLKALNPSYNRYYVTCRARDAGDTIELEEDVVVLVQEK